MERYLCSALLDKLRDRDTALVVLAGFDCELTQPVFCREKLSAENGVVHIADKPAQAEEKNTK